jgi:hypothetical protein
LVFQKSANFVAGNWRKSPKIVIITLTLLLEIGCWRRKTCRTGTEASTSARSVLRTRCPRKPSAASGNFATLSVGCLKYIYFYFYVFILLILKTIKFCTCFKTRLMYLSIDTKDLYFTSFSFRVARFFLVQHTKTGTKYQMPIKYTKIHQLAIK